MKIAYLTSRYPAVSHTFIAREVSAVRSRGVEVGTFSVRRATADDIRGPEAREEARHTRWLVPPAIRAIVAALLWAGLTRPLRTTRLLAIAVLRRGEPLSHRAKWLGYSLEAILLAHWLAAESYEHLHCHFGNSGSSTGWLAARLAGIPFSITCHGSELNESSRHRLAEKAAEAAFVACVSRHGKSQLMLVCRPDDWHKLHVIHCGVPMPSPSSAPTARRNEILCVARLSPEKGHLVLIDALAQLRQRSIHFHCTLVGDGPMRSAVEAAIHARSLVNYVTLTGSLPPDEVAARMRSASVVVLPSFTEGIPVVLMEALSHRRPVVATRVGGVAELVEHGRCGLLVSPGDPDELANALVRTLQDRAWAASLAEKGFARVRDKFCPRRSADHLMALFAEAIRQSAKGLEQKEGTAPACPTNLPTEHC